ncbi:MAG: hypothetical protein HYT31_02585 [Parcubacteria group bacterium]|nr:hypothetical protein [Parcubacteria group bacterium]
MRILLLLLAAFAIDAVFAPALTDGFRMYTGFVAVLYAARCSTDSSALFGALFYGLMLDILNPLVPFGTFEAVLALSWAAVEASRGLVARIDSKRTLLAVLALVFGYALGFEVVVHLSVSLFSALPATLPRSLAAQALYSALATVTFSAFVALVARAGSAAAHKWLLISKSAGSARKA